MQKNIYYIVAKNNFFVDQIVDRIYYSSWTLVTSCIN